MIFLRCSHYKGENALKLSFDPVWGMVQYPYPLLYILCNLIVWEILPNANILAAIFYDMTSDIFCGIIYEMAN